jgi:DNA polymerase-3 subunit epsilon
MKILGIDFETTGLDPRKDRITEVGLVLWDSESKQPVRVTGFLVKTPTPVSAEISRLTGITNELLRDYGVDPVPAMKSIVALAAQADFMCAHNGTEFDKLFLEAELQRRGADIRTLPWIDTRTDLPHAAYSLGKSASLKYLACDHGFVYPAHRAVNDVLAMLEILGRYDLETTIKRAQTPNVNVRAVVSFDDRLLAKERGYYWKPESKLWVKPLKADEVDAEKEAAPFPVVLMEAR